MTQGSIQVLSAEDDLDDAFAIRQQVFVEEQGVAEELEYDGRDGESVHLLAREDGDPVGTARLRPLGDGTAKVERVAVLRESRGNGWGRRLMEATERLARQRDLDAIVLHAQRPVEGFYHDCDYETTSDVFEEAGIPHVEMEKSLSSDRPTEPAER